MELEERLKKLLKLSERGIDGEKEAATKILNNLINKKEEILEFKEIKAIVKLLLNVDKKLERLMPKEIYMKMKMEESEEK